MEKIEETNTKDYDKIKKKAGEFAKFLIENEFTFKQEINDFNNSLGCYFDINGLEGDVITFVFADNGYSCCYKNDEESKEKKEDE